MLVFCHMSDPSVSSCVLLKDIPYVGVVSGLVPVSSCVLLKDIPHVGVVSGLVPVCPVLCC